MKRFVLLAVVAALFGLSGCDGGTTRLSGEDDGARIELVSGDEIVVELESNPSTGYSWQVASSKGARQKGEVEYVGGDTDVVGAAGVERFTFVREGSDAGVIALEYRRPWETTEAPEDTWSLTITGD